MLKLWIPVWLLGESLCDSWVSPCATPGWHLRDLLWPMPILAQKFHIKYFSYSLKYIQGQKFIAAYGNLPSSTKFAEFREILWNFSFTAPNCKCAFKSLNFAKFSSFFRVSPLLKKVWTVPTQSDQLLQK